jgi:hypothetical protein
VHLSNLLGVLYSRPKMGVKLLTELNPPKDQTVVKACRCPTLIKERLFDGYLAVVPTVQSAFDV